MPKYEYDSFVMRNAYIFPEVVVPLANQGLVQVRSLNVDDGGFLGCGKSSLFNGFSRLQIGKSGKEDKVDEIVFDQVGSDMEKILRLKKDGKPLEIRQYRKHQLYGTTVIAEDLTTGADLIPSDAKKHPHTYIRDEILGIDETTFLTVLYLMQNFNHELLQGKDSQKYKKLTAMFDLDLFDKLLDQTKSHTRILQTKLTKTTSDQGRLEEKKKELAKLPPIKKLKKKHKVASKKMEAYQAGWYVSTKELEDRQELLAQLSLRFNYEKELSSVWDENPVLRDRFSSIESITDSSLDELDEEISLAIRKRTKLEGKIDGAKRRQIIESQLASIEDLLTDGLSLKEAEDELEDLKSRLHYLSAVELPAAEKREELLQKATRLPPVPGNAKKIRSDYEEVLEEITSLKSKIGREKHQLDSGVCGECGRPLSLDEQEFSKLVKSRKHDLKILKDTKKREFALKSLISAIEEHETIDSKLAALPTSRSSKVVQEELNSLRSKDRKLSKFVELTKQREVLEGQLSGLPKKDPNRYKDKVQAFRKKAASLKNLAKLAKQCHHLDVQLRKLPSGDRKQLRREVKDLRTEIRSLGSKIKKWSAKLNSVETLLDRVLVLKREVKKLKKELSSTSSIRRDLDCYEALKLAFGPKGLKKERFQSILQEATQKTIPTYTDILWPNKQVQLHLEADDGIQFYLKRKNKEQSTRSHLLSGGEAHKAGLALILGLRDLKELYTDTSFNLLIIDEPFGNLDPQGELALLSILELLKRRFSSIFVISHRPEVIESSVWDQTWWVIRENNRSQLWTKPPPVRYEKLARSFLTTSGAL